MDNRSELKQYEITKYETAFGMFIRVQVPLDSVNSSSTKFECFEKEEADHEEETKEESKEVTKFNKVVRGT